MGLRSCHCASRLLRMRIDQLLLAPVAPCPRMSPLADFISLGPWQRQHAVRNVAVRQLEPAHGRNLSRWAADGSGVFGRAVAADATAMGLSTGAAAGCGWLRACAGCSSSLTRCRKRRRSERACASKGCLLPRRLSSRRRDSLFSSSARACGSWPCATKHDSAIVCLLDNSGHVAHGLRRSRQSCLRATAILASVGVRLYASPPRYCSEYKASLHSAHARWWRPPSTVARAAPQSSPGSTPPLAAAA